MNPTAETNETLNALPAFQPPSTLGDAWDANWSAAGLSTPVGVQQPRREAVNDLLDAYQRATGKSVFDAAADAGMPISSWAYTGGKLMGMLTSSDQSELTGVAGVLASRLPDQQAKQVEPFLDVDARAADKAQAIEAQAADVNARTFGLTDNAAGYVAGLARGLADPTTIAGALIGGPEGGGLAMTLAREFAVNAGIGAATHVATAPERQALGLPDGSLIGDALMAGYFGAGLSGLLRGAGWALRRSFGDHAEPPPKGYAPNTTAPPDLLDEAGQLAPADFEAAARVQDRDTALDALAPEQSFQGRAAARAATDAAAAHIETGDAAALAAPTPEIGGEEVALPRPPAEAGAVGETAPAEGDPFNGDPAAIAGDVQGALQSGSIDTRRFSSAPTSEQVSNILDQGQSVEDAQADQIFGADAAEAKRLMRSKSSKAYDALEDLVEKHGSAAEGLVYGMHGFPIIDRDELQALQERLVNVEMAVDDAAKGEPEHLARELAWIAPKLPDISTAPAAHSVEQREAILSLARAFQDMREKGVDTETALRGAVEYTGRRVSGDEDDARVLLERLAQYANQYGDAAHARPRSAPALPAPDVGEFDAYSNVKAVAKAYGIQFDEASSAARHSGGIVELPANLSDQDFVERFGATKADVAAHEVAHALLSKWGMTGEIKGEGYAPLRAELRGISRDFRPAVWDRASGYAGKSQELLADGLATWITRPEARANMPLFAKLMGGRLDGLHGAPVRARVSDFPGDKFLPAPEIKDTEPPKSIWREPTAGKAPKAPTSLLAFLKSRGGIKDEHGDLRDFVRGYPGLIDNKKGMPLDRAREAAVEAGYFGADKDALQGSTSVGDLVDLVHRHPTYSTDDAAQLEAMRVHEAGKSYLDRVKSAAGYIDHAAEEAGYPTHDREHVWTAAEHLVENPDLDWDGALERAAIVLDNRNAEQSLAREAKDVTGSEGGASAREGTSGEGDRSAAEGAVGELGPPVRRSGEVGGQEGGQGQDGGEPVEQTAPPSTSGGDEPNIAAQRADVERGLADAEAAGGEVHFQTPEGTSVSARDALSAVDEFKAAARELAGCILKF